jgi:hypothetical protein
MFFFSFFGGCWELNPGPCVHDKDVLYHSSRTPHSVTWFYPSSVGVMYYADQFVYVEPPLHGHVIKKVLRKKSLGSHDFTAEF